MAHAGLSLSIIRAMFDPSTSQRRDLLAWAALARAPGLNVATVSAALDLLGGPTAIVAASAVDESRAAPPGSTGIPAIPRAFLASRAASPTTAERAWLDAAHHYLIPFADPRFPRSL